MTTLLLLCPIGIPLIGALVYQLAGWARATAWVAAASAVLVLLAAAGIAVRVSSDGPLTATGLLRADALSAYLLVVVGCVAVVATVATPPYLSAEIAAGRLDARGCAHHSVLVQVFLAVMACAVLAANLGLLWVAIEATTVVTAFLVGQGRTRAAVEAAWKYVVISSTGIALALLGTFLLNYADQHTSDPAGLDWTGLIVAAPQLDPQVTRIAVALLIIGFGTKAGLAPLHAWLPDAYSQAPTPVAALMSGVLSSVAFYAVLRVKVIADAALGPDFARALLLVVSLASLALAASADAGPARLPADAGIFEHREHGPARSRRGHRNPAGHRRRPVAHPWARPGQELPVHRRRPHPADDRQQPDRRRPRTGGPGADAGRLLRAGCAGADRVPAVPACSPASSASPVPGSPPDWAG